jgi:hypothetical protein
VPSIPDAPKGIPLVALSVDEAPGQISIGLAVAVGVYGGITLTTAVVEKPLQIPFCTITLYTVDCVRFEYVKVVAVLAIGVHVTPPFVEDSHLTISSLKFCNVNVPEFDPLQTVVIAGTMFPPSAAGCTDTVIVAVLVQPLLPVPVTVYVVVLVGEAVTVAPEPTRPVVGLHT